MKSILDLSKIPLQFQPYVGDNHNIIPINGIMRGGFVRFHSYINQLLSDKLWEDLTERFHFVKMRIYHKKDFRWCDCPGHDAIYFILDDDYKIIDMMMTGPLPLWRDKK